jgi:hypothetical protein
MPTLDDLLARVAFLAAMPAVIGVLITAGILVVSREWRLNVLALTVQYFFVVLLLSRLIRLEVAAVKGLIGWMICMVIYVTERRASEAVQGETPPAEARAEGERPAPRRRRRMLSARASFNLLGVLLVAVAAYTGMLRIPLPEVPADVSLACYGLVGLGLLLIGLSEAPMQAGIGVLTFLSGFDLFYVAVEPSLAVAALLAALSFTIVLVMAYLRTVEVSASAQGASQ